jgi:hypothetical protein
MRKLLVSVSLLLALTAAVTAQTTSEGHMKLSVSKALTVKESVPMSFGALVVSGEGTATVTPGSMGTVTGLVAQSGAVSADVFDLTGIPSSIVLLSLPASASLSNGVTTLYATAFKCSVSDLKIPLDANGKACITIGATVTIPTVVSAGEYVGKYEITLNYQ